MLDVGVSRLPHLYFYCGMENEFHKFILMLNIYNTHLKELSVTFQVRICYHIYIFFNFDIYYLYVYMYCLFLL